MKISYFNFPIFTSTNFMRTYFTRLLMGVLCVLGTLGAEAQVTVTNPGNTTPGLSATYLSLAAAINDLNLQTAISGPVTITLDPGNPQTAPAGGYSITAILAGASATNTLTFVGSGNTITAGLQAAGGSLDAIFKIVGGDYITIQNFTMQENPGNTVTATGATNTMTEFGVALFYNSLTNGAQNNTIQNNTISLNVAYANSVGIFSTSSNSAVSTTLADATSSAGTNSNNKIYGNNISNVAYGIYFICPPVTATVFESGNEIGGTSLPTGNTITFGNAAASSGPWGRSVSTAQAGIIYRNGAGNSIRFNNVTSNSVAYVGSAGVNGVLISSGTAPSGVTYTSTISDNTVNITSTGIALMTGIDFGHGISTGTIVGSNNNVTVNQTATAANSAAATGIKANYASATNTCNSNTVVLNQSETTGALSSTTVGVTLAAASTTITANSNNITINQTGSGTGTITGSVTALSVAGASTTINALTNTILINQTTSVATGITTGAITGIAANAAATTVNVTTTNAITVRQAVTGGGTYGTNAVTYINVNAASGTVNVTGNNLNTTSSTIRSTGTLIGVFQDATVTSLVNIRNNTMNVDRLAASGAVSFTTTSSTPSEVADSIINNNITFTNLSGTSSVTAIASGGGPSSPAVNNKRITGNTINISGTHTGTSIGISVAFTNTGFHTGNSITISCASPSVTGLTSSSTAVTMSGNTISLTSSTTSPTSMTGVAATSTTGGHSITGNIFSAMNFNGIITGAPTVTGISIAGGTAANLFSNTINNITVGAATSTANPVVDGILVSGGVSVNVFKNKIYGIVSNCTGATGVVNGIRISGGGSTGNNYYNNLIGDLTAPASSNPDGIRGISITSTSATTTNNVYYNTINIAASSSGANFGTSGIFHAASATATTATLNLRNNIIVNSSTAAGTGVVTCFRRSAAATLGNYGAASNNNDFFSATGGSVMHDGTTAFNITTFKAAVTPRDAGSFSEDPEFQSTVGASANFLKYKVSSPKQIESGAVNIGGITDDYFGTVRQGNFGYGGTGSAPDLGAWELEGIGLDLTGPSISYTTLTNTSCLLDRTLSSVTITDGSGVNTTAGTRPRLYYKKLTDANTFNDNTNLTDGWKYVEASGLGGSPFSFTTNYALLFTGAPTAGQTIQYFVVAQDLAGTPNVGINSGTFNATPSSVALTAAAFPLTGTINSYNLISAGLSGTVNIGSAETITSITGAANSLFATINANGISGNVVANIMDASITETGATALNVINYNGCAAGPYTLTIKPNTTATLTGSVASGALIKINGAGNVIIDGSNSGGSDKSLTITNTSATSPAGIWIGSTGAGTLNNTVKNCIISTGSNAATSYGIAVSNATTISSGGADNDNVTIQNNTILQAYYGIFANGTASVSAGGLDNLNINNNIIGPAVSGATNIGFAGISMANSVNPSVSLNTVQNISASASGAGGILNNATVNGSTISQNTVQNLVSTTSAMYGILLSGVSTGTYSVSQNIVSNINGSGSGRVYGIESTVSATINRNRVSGITNTSTATWGADGIDLNGGNNSIVRNNFVSAVNGDMTGGTLFGSTSIFGIRVNSGTGHQIYHNSVNLYGARTGTANSGMLTAAFAITNTSSTGCDVRNNIFANTMTGGTTSNAYVSVFLPSGATSAMNLTWNNNAYYTGSTAGLHGVAHGGGTYTSPVTVAGTGLYTAADFDATATTPVLNLRNYTSSLLLANTNNDNASMAFTTAAPFTSSTDLHIPAGTSGRLESGGASVGVTIDIDGDVRPGPAGSVNGGATAPDLGADEFDGIPATNMTYVSSTTTQNNVTNVSTNTTNQEVIGIQIVTTGALNPINATSFTIATTGTTNLADITNARLWYTGTSSTFATTSQFGSTVAVPGASFPIAGTQVLAQGINYFWLTYDVPCGATATNVIDAECNSVTVVSPQTPTVQAPAGSRTIVPGPMSGTYTVGGGGSPNYATLTAAIADVNTKGLGGNTTLSIMGNLTEAGAMTINQWAECGGSGFTLTIKPGAGSPVISASAATAVIILNGADRVIIDGSLGSTVNTTCPPVSASRDMTITNTNTGTSSAVIWLQTTAGANPATNNIVRNCNITGNASTTTLIGVGSGSATIGTSSLGTGNDNNSYINNNIRAVQIGIYSQGASAASKNNNTTINQNVMNAVRGSTPSLNIGIAGILVGFENFITIGGNVIGSAGGSSADGFGIAAGGIGISTSGFTGNEVLNATISYNRIDSIRGASTFSSAGIFVATSTNAGTNLITNNSISNTGTNGTSGDFGVGILVGGGPVTTNVYFNSVSMSGTFTGGSQPNFALAIGGTDPIVNIRNNVLSSRAVNGGGTALGVGAYAIGYAYGTFANLTVNNNDYYTTGTEAKFAKTGSLASGSGTDVATLLALQTATSQDAASISTDPLFNSLSNLQPQLGSPLVGAGVNIPAVFNDILCAGRANPPTIGAYETAVDATAPVITYTALTTSCSTGDRALNGVTITDASGVPTAGALQPRIYFRKNAGTWFSSQGALQSGSGTNGTWNFTIVAASMGGLVAGDVIQYYVIAQDIAAPSNIGSNPSAGLVATDVNNVTTAPTTPNSTTVGTTLNGTYTVGSGGSYPTLTAAVAAYNSGCLGGPVIFELLDATYSGSETFPIAINLNADASVTNTLTIRPATGVTAAITGSSTSIITFNGARFVTIDGRIGSTGSTHSLTITNTAASTSPAITLINDATSDAVRYTDLKSDNSTTTSGVVFFSTTTGANGNDNNTIDNCNIGPNVANPTNGIYSSGTTTLAAQNNSGNTISNNNIFDFYNSTSTSTGGVGVNISSGSTDWTINANSFYQTATRTTFGNAATFNAILLSNSSGNNFIVTNNFIGGSAPGCGGSPLTINTSATLVFRAFQASVGATTPTSLQGNTIRNINITTASTSTANSLISAVTGSFNIGNTTGNTLGSPTGTGSVSFTQTTTSTTTVFSGILVGTGTPGDINVSNNTVGSITVANSSTGAVNLRGISINGAVTSSTVNNNVVGSATTANSLNVNNLTPASTSNVIGIEVASGITVANSISGNTVANILHNSTSTAALCRGISYAGTGLSTISNNIVHDLSSASANTTVSGGATAVQGILYTGTSTAGATISLNEVYAIIASNNGAVQTNPTGIGYSNPNGGVITRNRIYDIRNASTMAVATTPPTAIGLLVRAAPSGGVTISNNMISLGNGQTTNTEFIGIINSFTNSGNSIFFNTVNIEGAAAAGALPSFCFLRGDNSAASAVTSPVDIRNNIFNNARTGGTGIHYAIGNNYGNAASSATGWAAGASNYNLLNGSGGVGYWNTTTNFAGWKAASASDANSISGETVTFVNSALGNLHLNMGVTPTKLESGGIAGTGVTVDFDNDTRPGPAGSVNGGATAPDMGADEFDGVPLDLTAPVITYTNLINTTCTTNRAFTATISDNSGINVTAGTKPRVYYKRSTDGNVWNDNTNGTDGWKYAEASNASSPFTFTINYSLLNGGTGVTGGNTVQYFVVAQDLAGTPNVAINSGTFALQPSSVALTGAAFPIGGTINSYNINASGLNTTLTVGALGDYTSLTGAAGLFNAINSNGLVGNTTVNILDASVTETGAVALNQINSGGCSVASYSLVIKPNSGVTATLTGTLNSNALVRILSSNVTIDGSNSGGTTRDLTITNTAVTSPSVILVGSTGTTPVTSTTIKNSILINGAQTATAVVLSDGTTLGNAGYFNNITVQNNNIQQAFIGVYAIGVPATGNGSGTLITGNDLNTAGANSIRLVGIYAQGVDGATVSNNNIANMANANAESPRAIWLATGTNSATVSGNNLSTLASSNTGAFAITGIYVTPGATATAITVNNNTINGLTNAGTGTTFAGILVTSPNTNITNNTVTGLTQNGAATAYGITASGVTTATISGNTVNTMLSTTSGTATGINIQGLSTGVNVFRNTISNIKNNNTGGWGANGIQLSSTSTTANTKVYNNVIYDVAAYGYDLGAGVSDNGYGIIATSGAGYSIDFNSVHMNTDQSASGLPAAFNVTSGVTLAGAINLRSNIFATTQTATSGTGRYAIYSGAAATVFGTINYNDYYSTSGFVGFLGSSQATIANWRTASTQDLNSVAVDPLFTTPTNLVVTAASPVIGAGVTVSGVTTDYLGSTRNALPSMGAYEQRVVFSAKVYLQGAYSAGLLQHRANTAQWTTATNAGALSQPYSAAPFSYTGTETVSAGFFANTAGNDPMDWVLLELRDATTPTTVISRRAAIIKEDGMIVDLDGTSPVSFRGIAAGNYFVVVRHRNHLGVRSGTTQLVDGNAAVPTPYDFTTAQSQALQDGAITTNAAMAQNGSAFMLWAGNVNQDVYVRATTRTIPLPVLPSDAAAILVILGGDPNATGGYTPGDVNLDGYTRATTRSIPLPVLPSDAAIILSTPLSGVPTATRQEHKVNN